MATHSHNHGAPTIGAAPSKLVPIASQGALLNVDWESRVDPSRLRQYRLGASRSCSSAPTWGACCCST